MPDAIIFWNLAVRSLKPCSRFSASARCLRRSSSSARVALRFDSIEVIIASTCLCLSIVPCFSVRQVATSWFRPSTLLETVFS